MPPGCFLVVEVGTQAGHQLSCSHVLTPLNQPSSAACVCCEPLTHPPTAPPTSSPSPRRSVLVNRGALPGSNGSDTRANALAAGLIVVVAGNYLLIILAALHDTREPSPATHSSDKDLA